MHIRSRTASIAFKFFIAIAGTLGLGISSGLFAGAYNTTFHHMFTNLSNFAVMLYFWCAAIHHVRGGDASTPWHPKLKYALTLAISVTGLVAHFMLDFGYVFEGGVFNPDMFLLHYVVPICTVLDWLLFDEKGHMKPTDPPLWSLCMVAYFAYTLVMVLGLGVSMLPDCRWPYPFIDFDTQGMPLTCGIIVCVLAAFIALGYVYVVIDRFMANKVRS